MINNKNRGESEIRTREPLLTVTRFPGVPLQPLEHLSKELISEHSQKRRKLQKKYHIQVLRAMNFYFYRPLAFISVCRATSSAVKP